MNTNNYTTPSNISLENLVIDSIGVPLYLVWLWICLMILLGRNVIPSFIHHLLCCNRINRTKKPCYSCIPFHTKNQNNIFFKKENFPLSVFFVVYFICLLLHLLCFLLSLISNVVYCTTQQVLYNLDIIYQLLILLNVEVQICSFALLVYVLFKVGLIWFCTKVHSKAIITILHVVIIVLLLFAVAFPIPTILSTAILTSMGFLYSNLKVYFYSVAAMGLSLGVAYIILLLMMVILILFVIINVIIFLRTNESFKNGGMNDELFIRVQMQKIFTIKMLVIFGIIILMTVLNGTISILAAIANITADWVFALILRILSPSFYSLIICIVFWPFPVIPRSCLKKNGIAFLVMQPSELVNRLNIKMTKVQQQQEHQHSMSQISSIDSLNEK